MPKSKNMKHIDHIGIAVKDIEQAVSNYETLLNSPCYKREIVESEQVDTAFFLKDQSKIELLGATSEESAISRFLSKKGEGLHHVAFEVEDIYAELDRLKKEGYTLLNEKPKSGADNKLVAFIHPKDNNGVLIELCQSR